LEIGLKVYSNAETDKKAILSENKRKAPAEEPQALREGPGRPFPELEFTYFIITNHWAHKMYVGSAVDLSKRFRLYYSLSYLTYHKNSYIYKAILKDGYSSFSLSILEYIDFNGLSKIESKKLILEREQHYIDSLSPEYNINPIAGSRLGALHSEESLKKISGENHYFYGKTHTPEFLAKMSEALKGEKNPMFGRTDKNHPMYAKTHSAETLLKMSKLNLVKIIQIMVKSFSRNKSKNQ
jgi:group I intron endonuclease